MISEVVKWAAIYRIITALSNVILNRIIAHEALG